MAAGVFEDAAGAGEAFPGFAVAFGADAGCNDDILGLEAAGMALELEDRWAGEDRTIRAVGQKFSL